MLALIINCGTNLFSSKILFFKSWFLFSPLLHAFIINFISFSVLFLLSPHLCSNIFRNHFLSNLYSRARNKSLIPRTFCYMLSVFSSLEISTNFLCNLLIKDFQTMLSPAYACSREELDLIINHAEMKAAKLQNQFLVESFASCNLLTWRNLDYKSVMQGIHWQKDLGAHLLIGSLMKRKKIEK